MGVLPPSSVPPFEIHPLICERCQDRLAAMNLFVTAMPEACKEVRTSEQGAFHVRHFPLSCGTVHVAVDVAVFPATSLAIAVKV